MSQTITEDDLYRTSSQYRLWSFSPESLAALRRKTHELALERARQYASNGATPHGECLTEEEELRLVQRYCDQIRTTSDHFKWPVQVKATAVQYLKRFYLSNSAHTYPPKEIYKTCLYLASKTEGMHMKVAEFGRRIATDAESVLAPEYKVMQALRFTLEVRQPYRGLKGVLMEMLNMAEGKVGEVEGTETKGARALQEEMLALEVPGKHARTPWQPSASGKSTAKDLANRVHAAYSAARSICEQPALMTDAYFLYTPSQILLAALHLADPPLAEFYLGTKLPTASEQRPKVLATVHACAEVLGSFSEQHILSKDERSAIEEKLERCRDPNTRDLVKAHAAAKRGSEDEEEKAKKRKAAREKAEKEGEDLFGPALGGKG